MVTSRPEPRFPWAFHGDAHPNRSDTCSIDPSKEHLEYPSLRRSPILHVAYSNSQVGLSPIMPDFEFTKITSLFRVMDLARRTLISEAY